MPQCSKASSWQTINNMCESRSGWHGERRRIGGNVVERFFGFARSDQERNIGGEVRRAGIEGMVHDRPAIDDRAETVIAMIGRDRRTVCRQQCIGRHGQQRFGIVEPEFAHQQPHRIAGGLRRGEPQMRRRALHDRLVKQSFRRRHGHQSGDLRSAARLTEDRHVPGIAAKGGDITAHPVQGGDHVEHSGIAGIGEARVAEFGEMAVPKRIQPMVQGHHDDIADSGEIGAVEAWRAARSGEIAAAMHPHHDRPLGPVIQPRRMDVEDKAVLAGRDQTADPGIGRPDNRFVLRRPRAQIDGVADAGPGLRRRRRHEAAFTRRGPAIGDALEAMHAAFEGSAQLALRRFHDRYFDNDCHAVFPSCPESSAIICLTSPASRSSIRPASAMICSDAALSSRTARQSRILTR